MGRRLAGFVQIFKIVIPSITHATNILDDEGGRPISEIGISIQGVDANHAEKHALRLAVYLHIPLRAEIEWRRKDEAAFPGERGFLMWPL
jgi:hypothetical protein